MSPQTTRPTDDEAARGTATKTLRLRRLLSPMVALSGVTLFVAAARTANEDRRRAAALGVASGGLLAWWVRQQGPSTANDPEAPDVAREGSDDGSQEPVDDDDASAVVEADDDVPAPDVDETDDRM